MSRSQSAALPPPYLRRLWLDRARISDEARVHYPLNIPLFSGGFELSLDQPFTIIVGENGSGKSTLLEAIAAFIGFDQAGGGVGYQPVDHSRSIETTGGDLAHSLRASWLPKVATGWFFKAESFFSVARYIDQAALDVRKPPPDFLSHSHGEGFLRFFEERCRNRGIYIFDEPESALSPMNQLRFLKLLNRMETSGLTQVILATHSPILMAYPKAKLLRIENATICRTSLKQTDHYKVLCEFVKDSDTFINNVLKEEGG